MAFVSEPSREPGVEAGVVARGQLGYDPVFGARPLKRFQQRHLETRLARALIAGEVAEDSTVTFKVKGDELVLG